MKIFNTLTRKIEELIPSKEGEISFYFCGMTVQDSPHLGHLRAFLAADILLRFLEYKGYEVKFVLNITDIDDKIIQKANKEGKDYREIAERYEREFFEMSEKMNLKRARIYPRATQHISEISEIIKKLMENKLAYNSNGNIWYDVSEFEDYGKLSGKTIEELESGARIEPDVTKKDPLDFSLWKKKKENEPYFYSPFGEGRPGWHIECSAMSMKHLGETIDIHGGGEDLIFPHHENEIAQSEGATGKQFVRYWFHTGLLRMKGEKMSKSTGIYFRVLDALEKYEPDVIRYFLLKAHYKSPLEYDENSLNEAQSAWNRIKNVISRGEMRDIPKFSPDIRNYIKMFESYMEEDLNTPKVFSLLHELSTLANKYFEEKNERFLEIKNLLIFLTKILGFKLDIKKIESKIFEDLIQLIIEVRSTLRKENRFDLSDKIRERLKSLGIELFDKKEGTDYRII
ncbi:MAG: cysteine--tRNA ligase [Candidatus Hydrothermales bacterium]